MEEMTLKEFTEWLRENGEMEVLDELAKEHENDHDQIRERTEKAIRSGDKRHIYGWIDYLLYWRYTSRGQDYWSSVHERFVREDMEHG